MPPTVEPACSAILDNLPTLPDLRPFPAVATRVVAACQDPSTSSKDLVRIIRCDPAIAARLLSVANSSMYGCSGRIRTVDHAVVVLGFRSVAQLALTAAGAALFAQGTAAARERAALWNHSLGVATVARLVAGHVPGLLAEEAFLAGIFHDVGKLFFYDLAHEQYAAVHQRVESSQESTGASIVAEELNVFGITHPEVGQQCGEAWGLTDEINLAIGYHHEPDEVPDYYELVAVIRAADLLAYAWQIGSSCRAVDIGGARALLEELDVSEDVLEQVRAAAPEAFAEIRQACSA